MKELTRIRISRAWCRASGRVDVVDEEFPTPPELMECMTGAFYLATMQRARLLLTIGIYCAMGLAHWAGASAVHNLLISKLGISERTAYEYCRVGVKLLEFDYLSQAFCAARLSYSKVRKLLAYITQDNERELVDLAISLPFKNLEDELAGRNHNEKPDEEEYFRVSVVEKNGNVRVSGLLNPVHGAEFLAALKVGELAHLREVSKEESEKIFQDQIAHPGANATLPDPTLDKCLEEDRRSYSYEPAPATKRPKQRPKITLGDILDPPRPLSKDPTAKDAGTGKSARDSITRFGYPRKNLQLVALFGVVDIVRCQPRSSVRAPGAEVNVILKEDGRLILPGQLGADPRQVIRLIYGSAVRNHWIDHQGNHLALGRSRRLVSREQEIALLTRWNYRCAMPGCTHTRFLEFHHLIDWASGGETDLDNLLVVCAGCHDLITKGLVKVYVDPNDPRLIRFEFASGECFTSAGRNAPLPNQPLAIEA